MQHSKEIVKDVQTALHLEQELQLSQAQHGVAVLDIYSSEWGNCKSLSETFRRLYMDAGDQTHIRFFSVECNSILESLNYPEEQRNPQRPKNLDMCRETLPEFWSGILTARRGKSKPYFVFYKEGTKRTIIEGINTPKIINYVRDLCLPQKPVHECITNKEVLEFWESYFSTEESEVFWDSFINALVASVPLHRPLSASDEVTLAHAIGIADHKVPAEALEAWVGNDHTIKTAFLEVFPSCKEDSSRAPEGGATSEAGEAVTRVIGVLPPDERSLSGISMDSEMASKRQLRRCIREVPIVLPDPPKRLILLSSSEGREEAEHRLEQIAELPTLQGYLTSLGISQVHVGTMCHAVNEKVVGDTIAYGKLAFFLAHCDQLKSSELLGYNEGLRDQLLNGEFFQAHPPIAFTTLCTCASDLQESEFFYNVGDVEGMEHVRSLNEGDDVVLPPFAWMGSSTNASEDTSYTVKFIGVPKVVNMNATDGETLSFNRWYSTFKVTEKSENFLSLTFVELVEGDRFEQFVQSYTLQLIQEEEHLPKAVGVGSMPADALPAALDGLSPKVSFSVSYVAESCETGVASAAEHASNMGIKRTREKARHESKTEQKELSQTEGEPVKESTKEYPTEAEKESGEGISEADVQPDLEVQREAESDSTAKEEQDDKSNSAQNEDAQVQKEPQPEDEEAEKEAEQGGTGEEETAPETQEAKGADEGEVAHELDDEVADENNESQEPKTVDEGEFAHELDDEVADENKESQEPKTVDEGEVAHELDDEVADENKESQEPKTVDEGEFAHELDDEVADENKESQEPKTVDEGEFAHELDDEVADESKERQEPKTVDEGEAAHELDDEVADETKGDGDEL